MISTFVKLHACIQIINLLLLKYPELFWWLKIDLCLLLLLHIKSYIDICNFFSELQYYAYTLVVIYTAENLACLEYLLIIQT